MNRHQSNPFLSDWDDDLATMHAQTNAHLFDAATGTVQSIVGQNVASNETQGAAQVRRSSCSQAELGSNNNHAPGRPSLYRRNMSSFEAASLQLEAHQQQMLDNNTSVVDAQRDLIAKMTADFQTAMQTNDKQFESLAINPFDPFETIVDDDGLSSPAPASQLDKAEQKFNLEPLEGNTEEAQESWQQHQQHQQQQQADGTAAKNGHHDSIDEDDEELVSTPVRNIKSSPNTDHKTGFDELGPDQQSTQVGANLGAVSGFESGQADESDSITKASMFAALLASAESHPNQQPDSPSPVNNTDGRMGLDENQAEGTTHVIKGSPNSVGEGGNDRAVSFFDPFETVIDKDALTSLVSDNNNNNNHQQQQQQPQVDAPSTPKSNELNPADRTRLNHQRIGESVSIETVIENQQLMTGSDPADAVGEYNDTSLPTTPAPLPAVNNSTGELSSNNGSHHEANIQDETSNPDSVSHEQQNQLTVESENAPASSSDHQYDSSTALERPAGRRMEPLSGIAPPQPTPSKRAATTRTQARKKASFQEDSSDSSDEDDRIQIVIRARDVSKTDETGRQAAIVPLLPPPPSKSSMKQARERGQVEDMPSPIMSYKSRQQQQQQQHYESDDDNDAEKKVDGDGQHVESKPTASSSTKTIKDEADDEAETDGADVDADDDDDGGQFVIRMSHSDEDANDAYGKCDTPLYDDDTSYVLEDYPQKYEGPGWEMMLRYPPKKKLTTNRFWKKIFVKLAQVPLAPERGSRPAPSTANQEHAEATLCWALQIYDNQDDKKPMQEIPIQATYTVSEISSQLFDQYGKIFTIKLQYIFYKERVGVRQGQLARFIHTGHIGSSTTSGGHGVDPISIGAIKRMGAPIEHSPQISQIIKLGCTNYEDIKQFKETLEDCLFRMPINRDRALTTYKTEEVQMAVRDETYIEVSQIGTVTKQLARVRLFFLSFLNGTPIVEVGINDFHRQGREVVGRMDILPVVTEEWIRLEDWELNSTVDKPEFESVESRIIKLTPPDATFFELMRFRIRPPRNRELPLQISANMSVSRTRVSINCEVMVPGCVSRKHGQIPCENIAIRIQIPECWVYFFREEKHFRVGSKKSVNRRPGKVKGIERFLGGGGLQNDLGDESSLIEVTSGQAKYEHHHHSVVWRAARWPKESQAAYVQNTMKIRLPLTAYDKMPENFYDYVHVEYTMPATTVSHTTLRSISVNPYEDEPPEKYVKYAAKYEYKVKMRLSVNLGGRAGAGTGPETSPIVIMKQPDLQDDLQREEDSYDEDDDDDDDDADGHHHHDGDDKKA